MSRLRIPIALIASGLALPAMGKATNVGSAELSVGPIVNIECRSLSSGQLNIEIECSIARVEVLYANAFARARNAEIDASIARVSAQRAKAFEQARNAESNASIFRVAEVRLNEFEQARNGEIDDSIARVAFHRARNVEINASVARVNAQRLKTFEATRNAEINASIALVAFRRARNAEINASIALVNARRALLETGAINVSGPRQARNQVNHPTQTCAAMALLLDQVRFASSSIEIDEDARPTLDELATLAKRCPGSHIEIHGHTDASGSKQANLQLSERRAEVVAAYLVASGIDMRRLKIIAHGAAHPILPNTTPEFRARNRRIEFTIRDSTAEATAAIVVLDLAELLDPNYTLRAGWMQP